MLLEGYFDYFGLKRGKSTYRYVVRTVMTFSTFPLGYIGLLYVFRNGIASVFTSFHQKLTFLGFKSIYSSKGEIRLELKKVKNHNYLWNENKS